MSVLNIQEQLTGGESVYCINQAQVRRTKDMLEAQDESGTKIRQQLSEIEQKLTRNEQAALAFTLIERLKG